MAGSILGRDQVDKINAAYPELLAHIRTLLAADRSAAGLMKVHVLTEYLDTTELARIFTGLSFISPAEKRALVRAAIFEVGNTNADTMVAYQPTLPATSTTLLPEVAKAFNPPQFKLNVNKASDIKGDAAKDTPPPAPVITNTAGTIAMKVQDMKNKGAEQAEATRLEKEIAVAHLRQAVSPEPVQPTVEASTQE